MSVASSGGRAGDLIRPSFTVCSVQLNSTTAEAGIDSMVNSMGPSTLVETFHAWAMASIMGKLSTAEPGRLPNGVAWVASSTPEVSHSSNTRPKVFSAKGARSPS